MKTLSKFTHEGNELYILRTGRRHYVFTKYFQDTGLIQTMKVNKEDVVFNQNQLNISCKHPIKFSSIKDQIRYNLIKKMISNN